MPRVLAALTLLALAAGAAVAQEARAPATEPEPETLADAAAVAKMEPAERARRLERALAGLSKELAGVETLTAAFVQSKHLEVFGGTVESRGTLALASPHRFAWSTESPLRADLVVNGRKGLRRRVSRTGKVTETTFDLAAEPVTAATVEQVVLWTRGDFATARESYDLELTSERPLTVRAVPRREMLAAVIASVRLTFSSDPAHLTEVVLAEKTGDRTQITFRDVKQNVEIPAERFVITPQRGR